MKQILIAIAAMWLIVGCKQNLEVGIPSEMTDWRDANATELDSKDGILKLSEGKTAIYDNEFTEFENFDIDCVIKTSKGAEAGLFFHTDSDTNTGYEIFVGNGPINGEIRTGSLTGIRNLYKSITEDEHWTMMSLSVSGKNIVVKVNGMTVVDYIEPENLVRNEKFTNRILSKGNFVVKCYKGEIELKDLRVTISGADTLHLKRESENHDIMALQQDMFPVIDYHIHLKSISKEQAYKRSMDLGINYGIAPNCGIGFPITNDEQVRQYRDSTMNVPFLFGMQGEGREWVKTFSKDTRNLFDYVFTDAMTFNDHRGRRTRLWIPEEVYIDIPMDMYMDMLVNRIEKILNSEPFDIYVNPTFLPDKMMPYYNRLWTNARMDKVITILKNRDIALEVNARYRIPSKEFIKRAKKAGVKFAFGTNNGSADDIGELEYPIEVIKECGITKEDMWYPSMKKER